MSKNGTTKEKVQKIVICLIYILTGVSSILTAVDNWELSPVKILALAIGGITALAGCFGMFDLQRKVRVWMGIFILIVAIVGLVLSISEGLSAIASSLTQIAISWLFIACT